MREARRTVAARGFTLVELLVVVAVVGLLIGLLLPALQAARESARRVHCANNLKQMGLALHGYHDAAGVFPPAYATALASDGHAIGPGWGWGTMILPYLEQPALHDSANFRLAVQAPEQGTTRAAALDVYACPSSTGRGGPADFAFYGDDTVARPLDLPAGQYVASGGQIPPVFVGPTNGAFHRNSRVGLRDVTDGAGQTLLVGERSRNVADATWVGVAAHGIVCTRPGWPVRDCQPSPLMVIAFTGAVWPGGRLAVPNSSAADVDAFWSLHPGGSNFLFADGSARFLKATIDPIVFSSLSTRDGAEVVGADAP